VIFLSYDTRNNEECETQITNADLKTSHLFVQTWVPDYLYRILLDPRFPYQLFEWDKIIAYSQVVGTTVRSYGAFTNERLDGLLCLNIEEDKLKIEFIATAPWNYHTVKKMRRIGSGLICFTIRISNYTNHGGGFLLDALPDAQKFYEGIGMTETGNVNDSGLKEYSMSNKMAISFLNEFQKYIIKN
jgi:hypothetical protein